MYVKHPLSLRNVEDFLHERWIDVCHETVRLRWPRFDATFADEIRNNGVARHACTVGSRQPRPPIRSARGFELRQAACSSTRIPTS
jgi:hypothetical protein